MNCCGSSTATLLVWASPVTFDLFMGPPNPPCTKRATLPMAPEVHRDDSRNFYEQERTWGSPDVHRRSGQIRHKCDCRRQHPACATEECRARTKEGREAGRDRSDGR